MNFIVDQPKQSKGPIVHAKDFGFCEKSDNNASALKEAIDYCKVHNASKLLLDKGVYHLAHEDYFTFKNFEDFIFDGCGAELIFHTPYFFQFFDCNRVKTENLILDWSWDEEPLGSLAEVIENDVENQRIAFRFFDDSYPKIHLDISSFNQFDPLTLTPGLKGGKEIWVYTDSIFNKTEQENILRASYSLKEMKAMKAGEIYFVRHLRDRVGCAFLINNSKHITLSNNTVYSTKGMTHVICGESEYIRFDGEKIFIRPNSNRYISTDGDGIHIIQSKGHIIIENCDFSGMGDDDVNIHDCHFFISKKLDHHRVLLENQGFGKKGDPIDLRNPDFSPVKGTFTLDNIEINDTGTYVLSIKEELPQDITEGFIMMNKAFQSNNYIIRNNYFHQNRARGLLLQCSNGIVENNTFFKTQGAAIYIMIEAFRHHWYEGSGVENLIIKNNRFIQCNVGEWTSNIDMMAVLPNNESDFCPFENITITNNSFENYLPPAMYLSTGKSIKISNNSFVSGNLLKSHFIFERCTDVEMKDNILNGIEYKDGLTKISNHFKERNTLRLFAPMDEFK